MVTVILDRQDARAFCRTPLAELFGPMCRPFIGHLLAGVLCALPPASATAQALVQRQHVVRPLPRIASGTPVPRIASGAPLPRIASGAVNKFSLPLPRPRPTALENKSLASLPSNRAAPDNQCVASLNWSAIPFPGPTLLEPLPEPDCQTPPEDAAAISESARLTNERQCYKLAEVLARSRLQLLQDVNALTFEALDKAHALVASPTDGEKVPVSVPAPSVDAVAATGHARTVTTDPTASRR